MSRRSRSLKALTTGAVLCVLASCAGNNPAHDAMATDARAEAATDAISDGPVVRVPRCEPHEVWCVDEQARQLRFQADPASGEIINTPLMGGGVLSTIDARSGGMQGTESFVYAKFTDTGLVKIELLDDESLTNTEWDIAFRRSTIRLNSGASGPSCVESTEAPFGSNWDSVRMIAAGTMFREESYFTPMRCNFMSDAIGRAGTLLASSSVFDGCIKMTHVVQLIQLRDGRTLKFELQSFYEPDLQARCDADENIGMNNPGGELRVRWKFL